MTQLPPRLQRIFDLLKPNHSVWDLCCDHGFIGLKAYESQKFQEVYFVDQVPEIINTLEKEFHEKFFKASTHTKAYFLALPAEKISSCITGNLVIAGVGSFTISKILNSLNRHQMLKAQRIIICPQNNVVPIDQIKHIIDANYEALEKMVIIEKGRKREIYVFDQKTQPS